MNKKYLMIGLFCLLGVGLVTAGYLVNSLILTVGVAEPFSVRYAVIGDAGTWDGTSCDSLDSTNPLWFTSTSESIPTGDMLAGESRGVCVEITNKAEAIVSYTINSSVTNDDNGKCAYAFGLPKTLTGDVPANDGAGVDGRLVTGVGVIVADDAIPVSGCNVVIDVNRG